MAIKDPNSDENRKAFLQLLERAGITQAQAAERIAMWTRRPCSVRAVRSWLNDATAKTSRSCPSWAVEALRGSLEVTGAIPRK